MTTLKVAAPGYLYVKGVATGTGGSDPFTWSNAFSQGLTQTAASGASVSVGLGTITLSSGGVWEFDWQAAPTGSNSTIQTYNLVKLTGVGAGTIATASRKLGTGADVGNTSLIALDAQVTAGDTYRIDCVGDTAGQFNTANLVCIQIQVRA